AQIPAGVYDPAIRHSRADKRSPHSSPARPLRGGRSRYRSVPRSDRPSRFGSRLRSRRPGLDCNLVWFQCSSRWFFLLANFQPSTAADLIDSAILCWPTRRRRIVIQQLVKFASRLHSVDPIRLRAALSHVAQKFLARLHVNAKRAHRIDDHPITVAGQLAKTEQRTLAKLSHVREQRRFDFLRKIAKLHRALQCLGQNCIVPGLAIFSPALNGSSH